MFLLGSLSRAQDYTKLLSCTRQWSTRMDHEPRRRSISSRRDSLANSIISALSFTGGEAANEDDMWSFTEAARKDLFVRTLAQASKNAVMPTHKKRKFVIDMESRIAASIGFIPPQALGTVKH